MSLYALYVREITNKDIMETDSGFATYSFPAPNVCYIEDIYIIPDKRECGAASLIADRIAVIAKERGCTKLWGTVMMSTKNPTDSIRVLLAYGMELLSWTNEQLLFSKDI